MLNPHGGALVTMNYTRVSYGVSNTYSEMYAMLVQAGMNEGFFALGDGSAADAFIKGHDYIVRKNGGIRTAEYMGHCYATMNTMGDPLVRLAAAAPDMAYAEKIQGVSVANGTVTASSATVGTDLGMMNLKVAPFAANAPVTLDGTNTLKVFNRLEVADCDLTWDAPGGVGRGVSFTGRRGNLTFTGKATRYFGTSFANVGTIRVAGSGVTLDFDAARSGRDVQALGFSGSAGESTLRTRGGDVFAETLTIPVTGTTLNLETVNLCGTGDRRALPPLFALTNATLRIRENPYWARETLTRRLTLNASTLDIAYANFGFGPTDADAGFDLDVLAGENRITSSSAQSAEVSGEFRMNVADSASLEVSASLAKGSRTGSLVKTGAGTLALRASNSFAGGLTVCEGTVIAGRESQQSLAAGEVVVEPGATLMLETLPAVSITRLTVKRGGRLVLPGAADESTYLIVDPLKASLDIDAGATVCNEHDLTTPLQGSATSDGYFMNTAGFLSWGTRSGVWTDDATVTPWLTSAGAEVGYTDGRSVQFPDRAVEKLEIAVMGALGPGYATFANRATQYVFAKGNDAAALVLDSLYTVGATTFEPDVTAASKIVVTAGQTTFGNLNTGSVAVAPKGALQVVGSLTPYTRISKIVFSASNFQGFTMPFTGQTRYYRGYQINGLAFLRGGTRIPLPSGTKVTAQGTFNGATDTKSMTITRVDAAGVIEETTGDDELKTILDDSATTGWGCTAPSNNAMITRVPSLTITLELGAPIPMFTSYQLAGGNTAERTPSTWKLAVATADAPTPTVVDEQTRNVSANAWWTSSPIAYSAGGDARVEVATGGTLYLNGDVSATVDLADGARLAVTNACKLRLTEGLVREGRVILDVASAAGMGWTPVLTGANLDTADIYAFGLTRDTAAAKIVSGDLYVATAGLLTGPYTRTVSGTAMWNTAEWKADGASFADCWSAVATLPTGEATLRVAGETTLAIDTPVSLGRLCVVSEAPATLHVTGTAPFVAHELDFSGFSGKVVWEPALDGASVVCGANDVTLRAGNGEVLEVAAGGVAHIAGSFRNYANDPSSRIDFIGAERKLTSDALPSVGTLSFEDATLSGDFDNPDLTLLVESGNALVLNPDAASPTTVSFEIRGGTVTVSPGAVWRFGANGRTRFEMSDGTFTCTANGTARAGDAAGLVIGTTEESSYPVARTISGGDFRVPDSYLNFYNAAALTVTGAGHVTAKGIISGKATPGTLAVESGGVLELGAFGVGANAVDLVLNGGVLAATAPGATVVAGAVKLGGAGMLAASEGAVLCLNGAVTGAGVLTLGAADRMGEVRLANPPEAETVVVAGGTWHLGALRPLSKMLAPSAGAIAVTLSRAQQAAAQTAPLRLLRTDALPSGGVVVLDRRGVPAEGAVVEIADGYLTVRTTVAPEGDDSGGDSISINIIGGAKGLAGRRIQSGAAGAFPVAVQGWNQLAQRSDSQKFTFSSALTEVTADGLALVSTVEARLSGSCTYVSKAAVSNADAELMYGYIDDGDGGATFEITGIPYTRYDVYVYMGSDQSTAANSFGPVTVTAGGTTAYPSPGTAWGCAASTHGAVTLQEGVNYFRVRGLAASELTVRGATKGSPTGTRCGIAGIQIVNTGGRKETFVWSGLTSGGVWSVEAVNWRAEDAGQVAWPASGEGNFAVVGADSTLEVRGEVAVEQISLTGVETNQVTCLGRVPSNRAVLFPDTLLGAITGLTANLVGAYVSNAGPATPYHFKNDGETVRVQFQKTDGDYVKCVKLELRQDGADVVGRYVYMRYKFANGLGSDFDSGATDYTNYHLENVTATVLQRPLTLTGAGRFTRPVVLTDGLYIAPKTLFAAGYTVGANARLVFTPQVVYTAPDGTLRDITGAFVREANGTWRLDAAGAVTMADETIPVVPELAAVPEHAALEDVPFAVTETGVHVGIRVIPGLTYALCRGAAPDAVLETPIAVRRATTTRLALTDDAPPEDRAFYRVRVSYDE